MNKETENWSLFNNYWIHQFPGELLIVRYENLKEDIVSEVKRMTTFLKITVTDQVLRCTETHSGGSHHRIHTKHTKQLDKFTDTMMKNINDSRKIYQHWI